jgi:hypothetical protein
VIAIQDMNLLQPETCYDGNGLQCFGKVGKRHDGNTPGCCYAFARDEKALITLRNIRTAYAEPVGGAHRSIGWVLASSKVPRLNLDLIDGTIRIGNVPRLRHASRIETRTAVVEFVATAVQRECGVTIADAS